MPAIVDTFERGRRSGDRAAPRRTACRIACALSSEPITAMPSAAPTWRTVVLVPLATPALLAIDVGQDHVGELRAREPDADAEQHRARERARAASCASRSSTPPPPARRASNTSPIRTTRVVPMIRVKRPPSGAPNAMQHAHRHHVDAGAQRGEVLAVLQQHGNHEQEPELPHREHHRRLQAVAEARVLELAELEQRIARCAVPSPARTRRTPRGSRRPRRSRPARSRPAASPATATRPLTEKSCSGRNMP